MQRLIARFYGNLRAVIKPMGPESLLDAGCGEGETLARLGDLLPQRVVAIDLSGDAADFTAARFPAVDVQKGSVTHLPFDNDSFDVALCLEVLEHLPEPELAIDELVRVSAGDVVISTPHEPWFRLGSLLRGKYLGDLGNHPEHVNHWNPQTLRELLLTRFDRVSLTTSFPWMIAHCQSRRRL